jgi:hypothetical protein
MKKPKDRECIEVVCLISLSVALVGTFCAAAASDLMLDEQPSPNVCGHVSEKSLIKHEISVEENTSSALFFLNWTESRNKFDFHLIDPAGNSIDKGSKIAGFMHEETYEYYFLQNPMSGLWKIEIQVPDLQSEESYCLLTDFSKNETSSCSSCCNNGCPDCASAEVCPCKNNDS